MGWVWGGDPIPCPCPVIPSHNPIFTPGIFSGINTQNEAAWTKLAWFDEGSSHQITSKRGLGHISWSLGSFDQIWLRLTKFDRGLTKPFLTRPGSTIPKNPQNVVRDTFPRVWRALTKFDQIWLRLTKFDRGLTGPLTRPKAGSNWPPLDQCVEHVESFDLILYRSKTDEKRGSYRQNCGKRSNT